MSRPLDMRELIPDETLAARLDALERDVAERTSLHEWLSIQAIENIHNEFYWNALEKTKAELEQAIRNRDEVRARGRRHARNSEQIRPRAIRACMGTVFSRTGPTKLFLVGQRKRRHTNGFRRLSD